MLLPRGRRSHHPGSRVGSRARPVPLPPMATARSTVPAPPSETIRNHAAFIWSVADLLRGDYKQSEYGKVILPLTVIRRLDCVLEPTKEAVLEKHKELTGKIENVEPVLQAVAGQQFYNTSPLDLHQAPRRPQHDRRQPRSSTSAASPRPPGTSSTSSTSSIQIDRLRQGQPALPGHRQVRRHRPAPGGGVEHRDGLPLRGADPPVLGALERDRRRALHAARGHPADGEPAVHRGRDDVLTKPGIVKTLCDPACGTGGMLSVAEDHLRALNPAGAARGLRAGAERRDLRGLPLGHDAEGPGRLAHRLRQLASPRTTTRASASTTCSPIRRSASSGRRSRTRSARRPRRKGFNGRFGAGLPRINDGSLPLPAAHDLQDEAGPRRAARASRSSSTARRCSPARPGRASRRSAAGSSRTTGSRRSSRCPTSSSTTPASRPTSGS